MIIESLENDRSGRKTMTDLLHEVRDGIATLTFNRPQARNALTFAMYDRMAEICEEANRDRSIRAMVLTGAGDKAFASGTDISQFRAFDKATGEIVWEMELPAGVSNAPMTYMAGGKQYIVVAVSGSDHPGELIALSLP
jgi:enoyl-CoA hydratase/carnithine racemase